MALTFCCLTGDSLVSVRGEKWEVSKIQTLGYHEAAAKLCFAYLPFQQQNQGGGLRRLERLHWVKERKCCGKVHHELFQLCLHAQSQAWVPLKTEHVRWQNRKKHTRPFVMAQGIPAIFITLDIKLDKYAEVWTWKHRSVPSKRQLAEKVLFFNVSLRVWHSLCCLHVKWDSDVLSLTAASSLWCWWLLSKGERWTSLTMMQLGSKRLFWGCCHDFFWTFFDHSLSK